MWPASVSSARVGRRGIRRSATRASRPAAKPRGSRARPARACTGPGRAAAAAPRPAGRHRAATLRRQAQPRSPRSRGGRAGCARPAPAGSSDVGSARRDRSCRSGTAAGQSAGRARSPTRGRCGSRSRCSWSSPAPARDPRRAIRSGSAPRGRARPAAATLNVSSNAVCSQLGNVVGEGGQRHRRDAAGDERALLAEGEREAEIEELAEAPSAQRLACRSARATRTAAVRTSEAAGDRACRPRSEPRPARARDRIEADHRDAFSR